MKATPILNTELSLEAPERVPDGGGGFRTVWKAIGTHWGEVTTLRSRKTLAGLREASNVTHRIVIRNAPPSSPRRPKPEHRFRSGPRVFAIHGVAPADRREKYLTCWAEEGPFA